LIPYYKVSGCSVARLSRRVWDAEVAGSNPATPTLINRDIPKISKLFPSGNGRVAQLDRASAF
jgi:hypothetical protein